jgi:hypothetical protein
MQRRQAAKEKATANPDLSEIFIWKPEEPAERPICSIRYSKERANGVGFLGELSGSGGLGQRMANNKSLDVVDRLDGRVITGL